MANKCPKCNAENPDTKQFCGDCGTQLPSIKDIELTETMETPKEELTRGTTFAGRYEIIEELGKGGMGRVYRVEDIKTKEEIALKLIKPEFATDKKTIERFRNELTSARKITHKNVCRMYDLGEEKGLHFITMEYISGQDLKGLIRQTGQLTLGKTISIAKQICDGLTEAHSLGVAHRDLKPNNIMIDRGGNAKIMDFGIARAVKGKSITGSGVMIGTPQYMSPEQVEGKDVDQRSDVYSLGIILYEMLTDRVPFDGDTPLTIGVKQKTESPKEPKDFNPQIPDDLNHVILKCLEKDKEKRYQNAGEVKSELEKIEQGLPTADKKIQDRKPITSKEITVKFTPKKLLIPSAVAVILVAVGLFLLLRPKGPSLDPNRVVVAPFENKTGDPTFDNHGFMASDWITQGLMRTNMISVSSFPMSVALSEVKEDEDMIQMIAQATGSGKVVTGSYYLEGETLNFVAQVHDARQNKILGSVDPVSGPISQPTKAIELLPQKVLGVLAVVLDAEVWDSSLSGYMPTYDSYYAFIEARKAHFREDYDKSIELGYEAIRRDPNFLMPLFWISAAHFNRDEYAEAAEVVKKIEASSTPLSTLEKYWLESHHAMLNGDRKKQYNLAKLAYELDPIEFFFELGWTALWINRPREAIDAFKVAKPQLDSIKDWFYYWDFYAYSYHLLGEHKNGLKIARKARKLHSDRYDILWIEMRALAAMGQIKDLERRLEESKKLPPQRDWNIRRLLTNTGKELRIQGYREESMDFLERAIQWLEGRPESETNTEDYRRQMANLLFWTEKWEKAKPIYEILAEENPDNLQYPWFLGLISTKLGNQEDAQRISDELGKVERPYLFGRIPYYQACIASLLGDKEKALKLLRESVDQGRNFGPYSGFRFFIILESLADYPPFQEFMKPKG